MEKKMFLNAKNQITNPNGFKKTQEKVFLFLIHQNVNLKEIR